MIRDEDKLMVYDTWADLQEVLRDVFVELHGEPVADHKDDCEEADRLDKMNDGMRDAWNQAVLFLKERRKRRERGEVMHD